MKIVDLNDNPFVKIIERPKDDWDNGWNAAIKMLEKGAVENPFKAPAIQQIMNGKCSRCKWEDDEEGLDFYLSSDWDNGIGFEKEVADFCPWCGRPLTLKGLKIMMERK